jgi:hypothetical protein
MMPRILAPNKLKHLQDLTEDLCALGEFFARQGDGDLGDTLHLPDGRQVSVWSTWMSARAGRSLVTSLWIARSTANGRRQAQVHSPSVAFTAGSYSCSSPS